MSKNDGGAAFPEVWWDRDSTTGEVIPREQHAGMSLRDYFAAAALSILIDKLIEKNEPDVNISAIVAIDAYKFADAMVKAREPNP